IPRHGAQDFANARGARNAFEDEDIQPRWLARASRPLNRSMRIPRFLSFCCCGGIRKTHDLTANDEIFFLSLLLYRVLDMDTRGKYKIGSQKIKKNPQSVLVDYGSRVYVMLNGG
ncbi:MAG: hypothetical protein RR521_01990, partial [Clostridia bacterium]